MEIDVSGMPADDSVMQLEMKRRLARAEALRNQATPQGQMVGNQFVAPSWTQYLANLVGKIQGSQEERGAIKQYGEYQKTKAQKQAEALRELSGALEPKQVEQYADYNESGNMPLVETKMQQPTASNLTQALLNYGQQTGQPGIGEKAVMNRIEAMNKDRGTPIKGSAGDVFFDPVTHEEVFSVPGKAPKFSDKYSNIKVDEQSGKTFGINNETMKVEQIPGEILSAKPAAAPTVRTMRSGSFDVTQQWDPAKGQWTEVARGPAFKQGGEGQNKAPAGYQWTPEGALAAIPGGPGDPNTKPLTQDQANARLYSSRMSQSHKILSELEQGDKPSYNPIAIKTILTGPGVISDATNYYAAPETQSAAQAMRDFINATLRRESGATITPPEFDNAIKQYFPQIGDKPEILAQKRANRETAISGIAAAGYPGGLTPKSSAPAAPASDTSVKVPKDKSGKINAKLLVNGTNYQGLGKWNAKTQSFE